MKILWISANRLGFELLKTAQECNPGAVTDLITLSDKATTRMYDGIDPHQWHELGVKVHAVERLNDEAVILNEIKPDLVILCGWRQIVSGDLLRLPQHGFIGFHPTLLPYGRGAAPIINTILHGQSRSGLTMFYLSEGLDDGDIIAQKAFEIEENDHASEVYDKVVAAGKTIIRDFLPQLIAGTAPRKAQNHSQAFVFPKPSLKNNEIDLEKDDLETISRKIRALSHPYLGAFIRQGDEKLIIWRAERRSNG